MTEEQERGDIVWRSAVRKEAAPHRGQAAATLMWDMVKAYESIKYERLIEESVALKVPVVILRLNIAAYTIENYITMNGMVQTCARASKGIGAGCGAATTLIQGHYLRPFVTYL